MKDLFKFIKIDKIIKWGFLLSALLLFVDIVVIIVVFFSLPPFLPIFNQLPWGEQRLGTKFEFFVPLFIVLSFMLGNLLLLNNIYNKSPLIARILTATTLLLAVLLSIFVFQTIQIIL